MKTKDEIEQIARQLVDSNALWASAGLVVLVKDGIKRMVNKLQENNYRKGAKRREERQEINPLRALRAFAVEKSGAL